MQLLTGSNNSVGTSPSPQPPPSKKRRTNKKVIGNQLSAPMSLSASPQTLTPPTTTTPNIFNSIASFTENLLPLDMSKRSSSAFNESSSTMIKSPSENVSNAVSVVQSPKKSINCNTNNSSDDNENNDDVVVDVCGEENEKVIKNEPIINSPKLPKAESPDYEKVIANGYKFGMRPEFMPILNGTFNPFFLTPKPEQLLWNQPDSSNISTTITSSLVSGGNNTNGAEDLSTNSITHSPSDRSSTSSIDKEPLDCGHCGIVFNDRTLHLLHKGLHSAQDPWKCNLCGAMCYDKYVFTSHMISSDHA